MKTRRLIAGGSACQADYFSSTVSTGFFQFGLNFFGFLFGGAFLDPEPGTVHHRLGFFQTQTGDSPNRFDDVDLGGAGGSQDDVKFSLLFDQFPQLRQRQPLQQEPRQ